VRQFLTPRWVLRHLAVLGLVAAFLILGWWQVRRAEGGNALSLGYAFEWPVFALFVLFVWSREIRNERRRSAPPLEEPAAQIEVTPSNLLTSVPVRRQPIEVPDEDPALSAYNRYLDWLSANPDRKPTDYPRSRETGTGLFHSS
jgi:DNA-binding transcriptional regulator of glucitol operon